MHEKPNGSNGILETAVDEDIQYCLFKYLTPRLSAPVIINLGSLIEIQHSPLQYNAEDYSTPPVAEAARHFFALFRGVQECRCGMLALR